MRVMELPTCRTGVDLVEVSSVATSIERFGDRYLHRVFTEQELASSGSGADKRLASLAGRFAAKEATMKVLQVPGPGLDWRSIEVVRHSSGACTLRLTGAAGELARQAGLSGFSVSITHEAGLAVAVVMAVAAGPAPQPDDVADCHCTRTGET